MPFASEENTETNAFFTKIDGIQEYLGATDKCISSQKENAAPLKKPGPRFDELLFFDCDVNFDTLASVKAKFISLQADALQIATKTIPPSLLATTDDAFKKITFPFQQIPLAEIAKNCVKIKTDKWDICKRDGDEIIRYYHSNDGSDKQYWRYESKEANGIKCWITKESNLATYQYKVCLDGQVTTSGTCEYKEIDIEVGKYTGEILADKLAYTTTRIAQYTLSLAIASSTTDILNSLIGESLVDLATTNPEILSQSEALITGLLVPLVNRKLPANTAKLTELSAKSSVAFQEVISAFKSFLNRYKNKFNEFRAGILKWTKGVNGAGSLINKLDNALFSVLKGKVNQLDNVLKPQFLDDFANASDDMLKKLQNDNLFDVWKNDIRSSNIDDL